MNLFALFSLVAFVLFIQAAFYLFFFEKRIYARKTLAIVCLAFSIYSFFHFLLQISDNYSNVEVYYRVYSIGRAVMPVFLTYFFLRLSRLSSLLIISFIRFYMIPAYLLVIYVYIFVDIEKIVDISYAENSWQIVRNYTQPFFYFSVLNFVICSIISSITLFRWFKKSFKEREKRLAIRLFYTVLILLPLVLIIHFVGPVFSNEFFSVYLLAAVMVGTGLVFLFVKKYSQYNDSPEILSFLIIEQLKDFVIFVDFSKKLVAANKFFYKTLGYYQTEVQGTLSGVFFSETLEIDNLFESANDNLQSLPRFNELIGKDQKQHPVMVSCFINNDKFGNPIGYVLLCVDYKQTIELKQEISERLKKEKELTLIKKELESLVEKKTTELFQANEKLKLEIYERKRAEEHVKVELDKKITLVQEIHHRVKNNIQIIISLIKMLEIQEDIDEVASLKLHLLGSKVRSISEVHESFYALPHLAKINFGSYLKRTTGEICARNKNNQKVGFSLKISEQYLDIDSAISCGIIFVELLTNSLKYAFPVLEKGVKSKKENIIVVEFSKSSNNIVTLVVSDNGVGYENESIIKNPGAIGIELVKIIAKQHLKADFEIKSHGGTTAIIMFSNSVNA